MADQKQFKQDIRKALDNPNLRGALGRFADSYVVAREKAYEGKDFEGLRQKIAQIKRYAAENLDALADQFEDAATRRGAVVYRAKDGADAQRYIAQLAKERGVKSIVKSKSMASEEIYLNHYLEKEGLEVVETDLGEWIIQLMGQKPSHMVMPAIHLTREQVAEAFSRHLQEEIPPEVERLVKVARRELRKKFLDAGMGISGANLAAADTGTLFIVTNEGNARLATSLPPIHVALVGYEKLVPRFQDAIPILETLPRSATAQTITSYVTMITGAVPTLADGKKGRKELHIILLDNGRTKLKDDPVFKEAMQCIRCASCLNVCPVYQLVGGHVYGHIYIGGIGTILTAFFNSMEDADAPQNLCIGCGRCKEVCPGKIDIPKLVLELRKRLVQKRGLPFTQNIIMKNFLGKPKTMHSFLRLASKMQKLVTKGQPFIRQLPLFFTEQAEFRSLPAVADEPFRDRAGAIKQDVANPRAKVAFYSGCVIDFVYPEIGEAVYHVLNRENVAVSFPAGQSCCGAPATYLGDTETAAKLAKDNIAALEKADADYVVTACPTCAHALQSDFVELLCEEPSWKERALKLSAKVKDFSQLVVELHNGEEPVVEGTRGMKVTYHDSCHFKRHLGLEDKPRQLLRAMNSVELVEMKESDRCCGFGGSYSIKFPEISALIMERKIRNIIESGAEIVATDCPGCILQLKGGLDKKGSKIKVKHTAEVLAGR